MCKIRDSDAAPEESQPAQCGGVKFEELSTVAFSRALEPAARAIYSRLWPGCRVEYLRNDDGSPHTLDQNFGVDALVVLPSGQYLTMQEKYRDHDALKYADFTQEYKNGDGSNGEWFHLAAQIYFYGWANKAANNFEKWFLMSIPKYKLLVEAAGGLREMGEYRKNNKHGKASFYCIPPEKIQSAFLTDYRQFEGAE